MPRTLDPAAHSVKREAFVDAAQRLIQSRGYEQVSVQHVLDELDASRGAFYHYFDSKQQLLEAVVDRMVDAALELVEPIVRDPDLDAAAKLERVFGGIARFKAEHKAFLLELLRVWTSDDNAIVREKLRRTGVRRLTPLLAPIVKQGMDEGVFRTTSPASTAEIIVMLLQGFQDKATEMYIARQSNAIGLDEVEQAVADQTQALERVLGATQGSLRLIDGDTLREWFG